MRARAHNCLLKAESNPAISFRFHARGQVRVPSRGHDMIQLTVILDSCNIHSNQTTTLRCGQLLDLSSHRRGKGQHTWEEILVRLFQVDVNFEAPLQLGVVGELEELLDDPCDITRLLPGNPTPVFVCSSRTGTACLGWTCPQTILSSGESPHRSLR